MKDYPKVGDVLYLPVEVTYTGLSDPTNGPYVKGRVLTSPAQAPHGQTWSISVECLRDLGAEIEDIHEHAGGWAEAYRKVKALFEVKT